MLNAMLRGISLSRRLKKAVQQGRSEVYGAKHNERHVRGRRRDGEPAVSGWRGVLFLTHSTQNLPRQVLFPWEYVEGLSAARTALAAFFSLLLSYGCAGPQPTQDLLAPTEAQMKIRSVQTRTFEISDRQATMRGVIAALQDLGFIIERANEGLGLVTAARFAEPHYYDVLGVTVTVRPESEGRMMVRANAIYNNKPIEDPKVYQNFFATLERSLFITKP